MKNNTLLFGTIITLSTFVASISVPAITFAQTSDQVLDSLISTSTRGYTAADKTAVRIVSKTSTSATLEAPIAKKDGKDVTSYYITWAPISYKDITATSNTDDLAKVKDSDTVKLANNQPIYTITGGKLVITIEIMDPSKDVYVTIAPEDVKDNNKTGTSIEDFKFNLSNTTTSTTAVAGDSYNATNNKAIDNVTCVWDATANRTTLLWDLNTAMNATKVEISHRPDETQGTMTVKGTPKITDRKFTVDTPHRNIQLFRLKPLDAAGSMIGIEIQYICKPDSMTTQTSTDPTTTITPSDPKKPIPVTPHTGPVETTAVIFFISLLGYFVYRKTRA